MSKTAKVSVQPWRANVVLALLVLMFLALVGRVLSLQVLDMGRGVEFLKRQGDMRMLRTAELPAYRGLITDRRGEPLAVSTPVISLWANPKVLRDSDRLPELASALDLSTAELEDRLLRYNGKQFMYLRRHLIPDSAREVLALNIPGVRAEREYRRFYPAGEVAAQLVGMTNVDGAGVAGLELAYDDWLRGHPGKKRYIKDLHGDAVRDIGVIDPVRPGRNLQLSIDLRLQYLLHRELNRAATVTGAEAGVIVTIDSHTGEVLASASYPDFNPNNRSTVTMSQTRNRALTDIFEPGSTMKPLTLVAALESGRYDTDTLIDTSPGRIRVGRKVLPDPRNYGEITLSRVVEKSSQVGITKIALDIGHEPIWDVFNRFGLGQTTATGFPGESAGLLPQRPRWRPIEQVTLAFGYGLTATPLQIARAYAVFANGGMLPELSLLQREVVDVRGERVVDADIAAKVRGVLHEVTGSQGTARKARVPGYEVGGKTGTVHKVGAGGYLDDQYVALFVGMAPIEDPRFVTVVVLDRPKGDNYGGGSAAAPVFARVAAETLRLLGVAPTLEAPDTMLAVAAGGGA
ncbi:peptidoglycan D,D-transpeptidase FtsI family protein [Congregibacter litoralis]|uniref:Peptidoglycan D,D-transpeptidase FtsI n=1 Tax=Congregibacter litoralis KT71 TaxID=314285 RepID=A4A5F4_9GAMM|nr:penicillin-binding protein 2 [Congregibacter litoralis]EAQ99025.1 peptidoglycan synthetase FtsI [Congregibacter litoralis KT71]